jgi:ElaB/YqjD/DUF883 family membrane-anchored ribosome-binding protein
MNDKQIEGTAGPAIAAHSKDAAVMAGSPASRTASESSARAGANDGIAETVSRIAGQAQEAANKIASSVTDITTQARDQLSERGITADQAAIFVRERPLVALLAAGSIGVILGMLIVRR